MRVLDRCPGLRTGLVAIVGSLVMAQWAAAAPITYRSHVATSRGNPITDLLILESDGLTVHATIYPEEAPGNGALVLQHDPGFDPVRTLVIGITEGVDAEGSAKTQIIMFLDAAFTTANHGAPYSAAFPGARHSETITRLQAAVAGDATELAWFTDVFFTGPAAGASFASRGRFRVAEFTVLDPIDGASATAPLIDPRALAVLASLLLGFGVRRLSRR